MDEKWQSWYASTLIPLLECTPGKELSPILKRDGVDLALLAADTDRTQEYVFESTKLPEIRGGSELLNRLNKTGLPQILAEAGLPTNFVDEASTPGCVIYAGGGGFLALVPASIAAELAAKIEQYYPAQTGQATITCVWLPVTPAEIYAGWGIPPVSLVEVNSYQTGETAEYWPRLAGAYGVAAAQPISEMAFRRYWGFGQIVQAAGVLLRRRKEQPLLRPIIEALPHAMRCQICRIRPAERMYLYFGESWPLCHPCWRKARTQKDEETARGQRSGWAREARSQQVNSFLTWLNREKPELAARYLAGVPLTQIHYAQDLSNLGEACQPRPGYIGFIYADGNRMGRVLESLPTPKDYRQFSRALQNAIERATFQALGENLQAIEVERTSPTGKSLGRGFIHPLEPLVIGGDDVMLITPGDAALPVAVRLGQLFEAELRQLPAEIRVWLPDDLQQLTLSVGVVIASSHNPVRFLRQIAKELCASAKSRAHDELQAGRPTSTLDFLVLKSQSMLRRNIKQLRKSPPYYYKEPGHEAGRYLTAAPYTLAEARRLLELLKQMRQTNFPTSQLQNIVAALHQGRQYGSIHYLYQQARLKARLGPKNFLAHLVEQWPYQTQLDPIPWHRSPHRPGGQVFASIVPDLLELYPFTPKTKATELWSEILTETNDAHHAEHPSNL